MTKKPYLLLVFAFIFSNNLFAQRIKAEKNIPLPTTAEDRQSGFELRKQASTQSILKNLKFENVGPTVMSGRVVDVDVNPTDPTQFFVAYASGGLWFSDNNGISFSPLFQNEASMTIGDIAVDWKNKTIWVGTGENNSSRSSYAGTGLYQSTDWGKSWQFKGLADSHHIGRIVIHPTNPDRVWVAAIGHLYSPNRQRGVFRTDDGGKSWKQTLFIDDLTGAIDLVINPSNPEVVYTAMWHRERKAWNFVESGKTSGIYQSMDGGSSWNLVTGINSGFPTGDGVGRIGLAIYPKNPEIVYAIVDNQSPRPKKEKKPNNEKNYQIETFKNITKSEFENLDDQKLNEFLKTNRFPSKYNATIVKEKVLKDEIKPQALAEYIDDAYTSVFADAPMEAEVYRSNNGGKSWFKANTMDMKGLYNTYGYYFGQLNVSPTNPDKIYVMGVPIWKSEDAGKTYVSINGDNVHADHHALWVNPNKDGHLINGNDGGINISYDDGKTWFKANTPAVGQFYSINYDLAKPYHIYGGLQDNGVWMGPSNYKFDYSWYDDGEYPYKRIGGGDGMQVAVDTRDNNFIYAGSQYGNYYRYNRTTKERIYFQPKHELGERPLRWNWEAPIHLSKHNMDIVYFGANKVYRSLNKAEDFTAISPDLTKGGIKGDVTFGTLTTIEESALKFGLIYVGSDDGLIHVTKNGGTSWENISKGLPADLWVSQVYPSKFAEGRIYASLNGYRQDHFKPYLYVSDNYGKTWLKVGNNLPDEPINVVKEDPENENIIYVGTDHGLYISLDKGLNFYLADGDLPNVAIHDLAVHPREHDLLIATHGRSIFKANVKEIQQLSPSITTKGLHVFSIDKIKVNPNWGAKQFNGEIYEPKIKIAYYTKAGGTAIITITNKEGKQMVTTLDNAELGMNYAFYNLALEGEKATNQSDHSISNSGYLPAGTYQLTISINGEKASTDLILIL